MIGSQHRNSHTSFSLFSQYAATFAAVSGATAYAVVRRPPNGVPVMLVAGAAGSLVDMIYAWNFACLDQVQAFRNDGSTSTTTKVAESNRNE